MADSIREQIIAAVVTAIDVSATVAAYRSRAAALAVSQLPAIIVSPIRDTPSSRSSSVCWIDWRLDILVEVVVNTEPQDKVADPLLQAVHSALMAGDRTLGIAGVIDVEATQCDFLVEHMGTVIPMVRAQYAITYRTRPDDLASTQ